MMRKYFNPLSIHLLFWCNESNYQRFFWLFQLLQLRFSHEQSGNGCGKNVQNIWKTSLRTFQSLEGNGEIPNSHNKGNGLLGSSLQSFGLQQHDKIRVISCILRKIKAYEGIIHAFESLFSSEMMRVGVNILIQP